jgi:glutamyl-tRNA reductase
MPADRLLAVGLSHRTAPVEVRERLALDEAGVKRHLERLRAEGIVEEAFLVSTCNRVELYALTKVDAKGKVKGWLDQFHAPGGENLDRYLYWKDGRDAIVHLFRVASSLDSMVVGEPQILGQVKEAVRVAEETGSLGKMIGKLAQKALHVAKRVRSDTAIGRFRVGIGNAGVDLARQIFGDLSGRKAMLVGTGEMGTQVAKALLDDGLSELLVANRTFQNAVTVATEFRGTAVPYDKLEAHLAEVDIVICATGAQQPILGPAAVHKALKARRYHPLFLVDLAVPRNVDPAVADIEEAFLFNVDDLTQVLERGKEQRSAAAAEALRIVEEEADKFIESLRELQAGPAIGRLVRHVEEMRRAEIERSKRLTDGMTPEQAEALDAMTRAFAKKLLDGPLRAIRDAARVGDAEAMEELLKLWEVPDDHS